ncbi:hypothetical protein Tco_0428766 [Tanacetum coccineum]
MLGQRTTRTLLVPNPTHTTPRGAKNTPNDHYGGLPVVLWVVDGDDEGDLWWWGFDNDDDGGVVSAVVLAVGWCMAAVVKNGGGGA